MPVEGKLVTEFVANGVEKVALPFVIVGNKDRWTVPAGFTFDGASVPRFLWWYFGRDEYKPASAAHDFLWALARIDEAEGVAGRQHGIDPVDADGLFRKMLKDLGAPPWVRFPAWWVVRGAAILAGRPGRWGKRGAALYWALTALAPAVLLGVPLDGALADFDNLEILWDWLATVTP